ncbi:MAG: NAD(P)-dependent oxidoreductase [Alphaproteobacteria bacterium]|nr:NAD(P)-dependent oxidoreductase [Alphaproteobacteria bacterium]
MTKSIGIIGLGNAGAAMCRALIGKGVSVIGVDLAPARQDAARTLGVVVVDTPAAVAAQADRIILSLPKPEASLATVEALMAAEHRPTVIIETSTVTPKTVIACHARCAPHRVAFVDAAIAGGVASMAAAEITFFLGGSADDIAKARPVLDLLAQRIFELGPIGAGMGAKVVNNGVMHAVMVVLAEAFAVSTKLGIAVPTMIDILSRPDGLMRPLEHRVGERIRGGDYAAGMSVSNARKDSVLALETAQELGVPLFAHMAAHTPYEIAESTGMGELDYAAIAKLWEHWAGVSLSDKG